MSLQYLCSFLHKHGLTTYFKISMIEKWLFLHFNDAKVQIHKEWRLFKKSALHTNGAFFSLIGLHCISLPGLIFNLDELAETCKGAKKRFSAKQENKSTNSGFLSILGYFKTELSLWLPKGTHFLNFNFLKFIKAVGMLVCSQLIDLIDLGTEKNNSFENL